jgi:hypothetical protein
MAFDAQANADDLDAFAQQLERFINQLDGSSRNLRAQFAVLGWTWNDTSHQKYADEFENAMRTLDHFIRSSQEHIPFLKTKARMVREYASHRL